MKTNFGMAMAISVLLTAELCPGQLYWKKSYKANSGVDAYSMTRAKDGNFVMAGKTTIRTPDTSYYSSYLLKVTQNGDTEWSKICGGIEANGIVQAQDGSFIVSGDISSYGGGFGYYIFRVSPTADTLWTRQFGGNYDYPASLIKGQDGNFLITGKHEPPSGRDLMYALKINLQGDAVWSKSYGGDTSFLYWFGIGEKNGNYLLGGAWIDSLNNNIDSIELGTLTSNSDLITMRRYPLGFCAFPNQALQTGDGGFLIMGWTRDVTGKFGICLLRLDQNGDTLWSRVFMGPADYLTDLIAASYDGGFIITASACLGEIDNYRSWLVMMKVDQNGNSLWTRTLSDSSYYYPAAICQTLDSNFLIAGSKDSSMSDDKIFLLSIIDDRYAWRNSLFTFKIPVSGDSLDHGYIPLKVPSGMAVSQGGTVLWTPTTDSVYMEHIAFLVVNDFGGKDTLTFNIFINSPDHPNKTIYPISRSVNSSLNNISIHSISSGEVRFSLPTAISSFAIYDLRGQLMEKLSVKGNQASWKTIHATGRYFAKAIFERGEMVKGFTVVR